MITGNEIDLSYVLARDSSSNNVMQDGFATEREASEWLFKFLTITKCFQIYREHPCTLLHKRHRQGYPAKLRCDFLLIPSSDAVKSGVIVIEAKKSGVKIGPALSQLMDYLNCSFEVRNGINVVPSYGFAFPCPPQHCAVASIMSHQGLGSCDITRGLGIRFCLGEERVLEFNQSGELIFTRESKSGKGVGSR